MVATVLVMGEAGMVGAREEGVMAPVTAVAAMVGGAAMAAAADQQHRMRLLSLPAKVKVDGHKRQTMPMETQY